jgi:hypothetical protein
MRPKFFFLQRWGFWWAIAWLGIAVISGFSAEDCRDAIIAGDECSGFSKFAYESDAAVIVPLVVALGGGLLLGRLQNWSESRPCPRCGERVMIGDMECPRCGFDFDSIGGTSDSDTAGQ